MSFDWHPPKSTADLNKYVDSIVDGQFSLEPPLCQLMCASLGECPNYAQLALIEDKCERVESVSKHFPCIQFRNILTAIDEVMLKNTTVRNLLEARGDQYKKSKEYDKAVRCYTLALSFAPICVVIIYIKRAIAFIHMKKFELALVDVEIALLDERCQSKDMQIPLLDQKKICLASIIPKVVDEEDRRRREYTKNITSKVQGGNFPCTALPDFISVGYCPIKGRYLMTNVDLEPGTTVLALDPYVNSTVNHLRWQTKNCDRCFKETLNPIPCEGCVFTIYCGEKCRAEDQKHGHKYDCPIIPYLHCMRIPPNYFMCLKAICRSGPDTLKKLWIKSKSLDRVQDTWFVPPEATHENRDLYSQVLNMKSHAPSRDMPISTWLSVSLAFTLRIKTTFFDQIEDYNRLDFGKFVATLILQHSESFPFNTMGLSRTGFQLKDLRAYLEQGMGGPESDVGIGVFPLANLINHSCVPTTFRHCMAGGKISMITNQALKAGDQLSHSYGFNYLNVSFDERNKHLVEYFHISCDCIACTEKWPMYKDMDISDTFTFVCQRCRAHFKGLLSRTPLKDIPANEFKCPRCINQYKGSESLCDRFSYILEIANELVLNNKPIEAVPLLIESIKHYQNDPQPSVQMVMAQDRLMNCYDLISESLVPPKVAKSSRNYCSIV